MRCENCQKFVSLEMQDPEVSDLQVEYCPPPKEDADGEHAFSVTGSVRIVRVCAECNLEMKEATLDIDQTIVLGENVDTQDWKEFAKKHDLGTVEVEDGGAEALEEGGGRYKKSYYGATLNLDITVDGETVGSVTWTDKVAASEMEELS
jgi:hypothetical protein